MPEFVLTSDFQPTGDQPEAIASLIEGLEKGYKHQKAHSLTLRIMGGRRFAIVVI